MPEIGEIKRVPYSTCISKFVWHACVDCGKERWVFLAKGKPKSLRCQSCASKRKPHRFLATSANWKGGRTKNVQGYILIKLGPDDFFYPMATKKHSVLEHRLVVAKALGRCLHRWEIVHHKKGYAKDDNRYPETLQLVSDDRHKQITILTNRIGRLEEKVKEQNKLIKLLRWQVKDTLKVRLSGGS